jgi:hypothetical protein
MSTSNFICDVCNKEFKTQLNLSYHKDNNKICLKKQGKLYVSYKCDYCDKVLTAPNRLKSHLDICKVKKDIPKIYENKLKEKEEFIKDGYENKLKEYENKLKEKEYCEIKLKERENKLKEYISKLEDLLKEANKTISEIAKQPKTIQTNTNSNNDNRIKTQNNLSQVFDINDIKKINNVLEKHLTPDVLAKGQRGVAEMLKEHLLQNEKGELIYECTDVSRQKFEFINTYGFLEPDPKATKLIKSLNDANIFDMAHLTGKKLWEKENGIDYDAQHVHMPKVGEVLEINIDSSKLRSHLANITTK